MKVFNIINKNTNSYTFSKTVDFISAELGNAEIGDLWRIEVVEMTEEEYEALPEADEF